MKYEITNDIKKYNLEKLIDLLEKLNNDMNLDETQLEDSIKIFEFAKKIEALILKKFNDIKFKFNEIMMNDNECDVKSDDSL
jgi:hypothetical protein